MSLKNLTQELLVQEEVLKKGGKEDRQKKRGRMTARERLALLVDHLDHFLEVNLWAGYGMYREWGEPPPAAGVITGIGPVAGRECMLIINDATVKAGAMFPQSVKKVLRAQRIAFECRLPILYLVDSAGVFLPLQDEIFPDEDDFGRIFRNNSVISAAGIPQYAAIMGNCIAGGGYLPVLCDELLMTEGSGLYLAGPALVKAAIGHEVDPEELGGAKMHAEISGTVDFVEKDDPSCINRLRSLVELLPEDQLPGSDLFKSARTPDQIYDVVDKEALYDCRDLLDCILDEGSMEEFKASYGKSLVTTYGRLNGMPVGVIANQRIQTRNGKGEVQVGGVLYTDSADKGARFVMECNQSGLPLLFFQDVMGFMVGKEAEQSGIIKSGAKLVSAVSNSIVPKITIVVGNSFGAGNYALCGKAYDPDFIFAWPNARYAVMGAEQASNTLFAVTKNEELRKKVEEQYREQIDIRYGAARGWVDAIIPPHSTREVLIRSLELVKRSPKKELQFHTGVFQV